MAQQMLPAESIGLPEELVAPAPASGQPQPGVPWDDIMKYVRARYSVNEPMQSIKHAAQDFGPLQPADPTGKVLGASVAPPGSGLLRGAAKLAAAKPSLNAVRSMFPARSAAQSFPTKSMSNEIARRSLPESLVGVVKKSEPISQSFLGQVASSPNILADWVGRSPKMAEKLRDGLAAHQGGHAVVEKAHFAVQLLKRGKLGDDVKAHSLLIEAVEDLLKWQAK